MAMKVQTVRSLQPQTKNRNQLRQLQTTKELLQHTSRKRMLRRSFLQSQSPRRRPHQKKTRSDTLVEDLNSDPDRASSSLVWDRYQDFHCFLTRQITSRLRRVGRPPTAR